MMLLTGNMVKDANAKGDKSAVEKLLKVWVDLTAALFEALIRQLTGGMGEDKVVWPVPSWNGNATSKKEIISSEYGYRPKYGGFHFGIDIACPSGSDVVSVMKGTVEKRGTVTGAGRGITIKHTEGESKGYRTVYYHLKEYKVEREESVKAGQLIAKSGASGTFTQSKIDNLKKELREGKRGDTYYGRKIADLKVGELDESAYGAHLHLNVQRGCSRSENQANSNIAARSAGYSPVIGSFQPPQVGADGLAG